MSRNWIHAIPTTEVYWLNRVLYDTQHKPAEMARFRADPDAYCRDMPMSAASKAALVGPDIGALYLIGVNPYLLRAHSLGLHISEADYLGALRAVGDEADHG